MSALVHNRPSVAYPNYRLKQWSTLRMQLLWGYEREMSAVGPGEGHYNFQSALLLRRGWGQAGASRRSSLKATAGDWLVLGQGARWQQFSADCVVLSIGFRFQLPTGEPIYERGLPVCFAADASPRLAQDALMAQAASLKSIAYDLGFSSPSHFHSWFKRRSGQTPTACRRCHT
ncbi:MAG: helix-turn-helix domain-containing protein [Opitutales bacterium]